MKKEIGIGDESRFHPCTLAAYPFGERLKACNYVSYSSALNISKFCLVWEVDLLIRLVHTAVVVCSGGIVNYFDQQIHVLLEYCRCLWYSNVLNVSWAVSPAPSSSSLYTSEIPLPHFPSTWGPCQSSNLLRAPNISKPC